MKRVANKKVTVFYSALIVVAVIFLFFRGLQYKPFESFAHVVASPFARFFSNVGKFSHDRLSFFSSISSLKSNNDQLFEENLKLKRQIAHLEDIENENVQLRTQLELAPRNNYELVAAMVIGRDVSGASNTLLIDVGSSKGAREQMAVIVNEGILVGKVAKVLHSTAYVELIQEKNSRVNAEIIESETRGIVRGQFGTSVVLDMIPQTVEINDGDTVITSGVGNILPRGLLIGYAQQAIPTPDRLFQQASLVLPVNLESIRIVWLVKNNNSQQ